MRWPGVPFFMWAFPLEMGRMFWGLSSAATWAGHGSLSGQRGLAVALCHPVLAVGDKGEAAVWEALPGLLRCFCSSFVSKQSINLRKPGKAPVAGGCWNTEPASHGWIWEHPLSWHRDKRLELSDSKACSSGEMCELITLTAPALMAAALQHADPPVTPPTPGGLLFNILLIYFPARHRDGDRGQLPGRERRLLPALRALGGGAALLLRPRPPPGHGRQNLHR